MFTQSEDNTTTAPQITQPAATLRRRQARRRPMQSTAFRDLAMQEIDAVYRMAFLLTRNPGNASDLVLETYQCAIDAPDGFEPDVLDMRLWLLSLLHNVLDARTSGNEHQPDALEPLAPEAADEAADVLNSPNWNPSIVNWEQAHDRLTHTFAEMSTGDRELLHLWAVEILHCREIAAVLGVPMKTAMQRLHRARSMLSRCVTDLTGGHMAQLK